MTQLMYRLYQCGEHRITVSTAENKLLPSNLPTGIFLKVFSNPRLSDRYVSSRYYNTKWKCQALLHKDINFRQLPGMMFCLMYTIQCKQRISLLNQVKEIPINNYKSLSLLWGDFQLQSLSYVFFFDNFVMINLCERLFHSLFPHFTRM